jgi:asparagine synthase (glutamine-hydrolysing)
MSEFQVYLGSAPATLADDWKTLRQHDVVFAFRPTKADIGEHGGLFATPDNSCVGVFSGKLFEFARLTRDFPHELSCSQKLALLLQQLYKKHGLDFPKFLYGFFSIVMWIDGKLLAVRDAIGERPVYILETPHSVVLSDRLATLMEHKDCSRLIHPSGVSDFLSTGFSPFARTPVQGISKLYAGTIATIRQSGSDYFSYHQLHDNPPELTEQEAAAQIRELLEQAVEQRFEENVKTGLLLSGGLDSSLVGALVGGKRLEAAYSLNFGSEYRNELEFSSLMAAYLNIPHRVITVTSDMIRAKFLHTSRILDEPIGDPLTVPNIIAVEEAAKDVQLVFNGEGGDPVFGGPKNLPIMAMEAYGMAEFSREDMYLRSYNKGHEHLPNLLSADFQQALKHAPGTADLLKPFLHDEHFNSYLHRLMHINLRLKGAAQILPKVLKASAAAGIAVRSPLFDQRLAELAFSLPSSLKLKGSVEKYVLKQAVKNSVPQEIIDRPKSGMLVPVHYWFNKELKDFAKKVLLAKDAKIAHLVQRKALENLIAFKGGGIRPYYGDRLWLLLSLELWMQAHNISVGV